MSGVFITFEGGEGSGKTTQLKLLADVLRGRGRDVIETREPGGTPLGSSLRDLLLYNKRRGRQRGEACPSQEAAPSLPSFAASTTPSDRTEPTVSADAPVPRAEMLLMLADRAQHVDDVIRPGLDAGRVVLSDRFADSTTAYQGSGRGIGSAVVADLNAFACDGCRPALTFLLDLPVEVGLARRKYKRKDVFQAESLAFHRRVRDGFLTIARQEPNRVRVIDATGDVQTVHRAVLETLAARLPGLG